MQRALQFLKGLGAGAVILWVSGGCSPYGYGTTPLRERWRAKSYRSVYPLDVYPHPWEAESRPPLEMETVPKGKLRSETLPARIQPGKAD